jgi:hypothetical protein
VTLDQGREGAFGPFITSGYEPFEELAVRQVSQDTGIEQDVDLAVDEGRLRSRHDPVSVIGVLSIPCAEGPVSFHYYRESQRTRWP